MVICVAISSDQSTASQNTECSSTVQYYRKFDNFCAVKTSFFVEVYVVKNGLLERESCAVG